MNTENSVFLMESQSATQRIIKMCSVKHSSLNTQVSDCKTRTFSFWVSDTLSSTQVLLALSLGMMTGTQGPYVAMGIEPGLVANKEVPDFLWFFA